MDREQVLFRLFGKYCTEGTILYTEGSPGEELFVIQSGAVRLVAPRSDGRSAQALGPGDILGEEAFFGQATRTSRAEVVRDARLIQVNDRTIDAVVRHGPQTARQIVGQLLALVGSAKNGLSLWTIRQILRRVAPHLTGAALGEIDPADLAERSGLVEADVRLVLEELQRRDCLVREGPGYRIPDPDRLQRVIDEIDSAEGPT